MTLLPTSKTKDLTSNTPCSFNDSLEICHPWLHLNLFEAIFMFCVLCKSSMTLQSATWILSPEWMTSFTTQVHTQRPQPALLLPGHFWPNQSHQKSGCNPCDWYALYLQSLILCHSMLFDLERFYLQDNFRTMLFLEPDQYNFRLFQEIVCVRLVCFFGFLLGIVLNYFRGFRKNVHMYVYLVYPTKYTCTLELLPPANNSRGMHMEL